MDKKKWQEKGKGHRQRLRDRFLEHGIDSLSDSEVIELLLTFGTPRSDCKEPARTALAIFGSLPGVLDASSEMLQQIKGIGPKNAFAIQFIQGIARRYLHQRLVGRQYVSSSREVAEYLIHFMRGLKREVLTVVFLDAAHSIIDTEVVAEGTVTVNTVYPRELIKLALQRNASALVLAHNHPSGKLKPSRQDISLTRKLYFICSYMHITLLDHLIIGAGEEVYSFADHDLMTSIKDECSGLTARLDEVNE
ncbi:MAG: hypothetical protein CSA32_04675 [Desulfobulbus propionicus]|nr:MAG: hypothetical protein CSA32_04675 [Desulfobulbus propionicus]